MTLAPRALAFLAALVAFIVLIAVWGPRLLVGAAGPEAEIISQLKGFERTGISVPLDGGTLVGRTVRFDRISVALGALGNQALVRCTVDFEGDYVRSTSSDRTRTSSLGSEQIPLVHDGTTWVLQQGAVPRLGRIVSALESRRRDIEGDRLNTTDGGTWMPIDKVDLINVRYQSLAWYIRSERDEVIVSEDYRLRGNTPTKPIDRKSTRRLTLKDIENQFRFVSTPL